MVEPGASPGQPPGSTALPPAAPSTPRASPREACRLGRGPSGEGPSLLPAQGPSLSKAGVDPPSRTAIWGRGSALGPIGVLGQAGELGMPAEG